MSNRDNINTGFDKYKSKPNLLDYGDHVGLYTLFEMCRKNGGINAGIQSLNQKQLPFIIDILLNNNSSSLNHILNFMPFEMSREFSRPYYAFTFGDEDTDEYLGESLSGNIENINLLKGTQTYKHRIKGSHVLFNGGNQYLDDSNEWNNNIFKIKITLPDGNTFITSSDVYRFLKQEDYTYNYNDESILDSPFGFGIHTPNKNEKYGTNNGNDEGFIYPSRAVNYTGLDIIPSPSLASPTKPTIPSLYTNLENIAICDMENCCVPGEAHLYSSQPYGNRLPGDLTYGDEINELFEYTWGHDIHLNDPDNLKYELDYCSTSYSYYDRDWGAPSQYGEPPNYQYLNYGIHSFWERKPKNPGFLNPATLYANYNTQITEPDGNYSYCNPCMYPSKAIYKGFPCHYEFGSLCKYKIFNSDDYNDDYNVEVFITPSKTLFKYYDSYFKIDGSDFIGKKTLSKTIVDGTIYNQMYIYARGSYITSGGSSGWYSKRIWCDGEITGAFGNYIIVELSENIWDTIVADIVELGHTFTGNIEALDTGNGNIFYNDRIPYNPEYDTAHEDMWIGINWTNANNFKNCCHGWRSNKDYNYNETQKGREYLSQYKHYATKYRFRREFYIIDQHEDSTVNSKFKHSFDFNDKYGIYGDTLFYGVGISQAAYEYLDNGQKLGLKTEYTKVHDGSIERRQYIDDNREYYPPKTGSSLQFTLIQNADFVDVFGVNYKEQSLVPDNRPNVLEEYQNHYAAIDKNYAKRIEDYKKGIINPDAIDDINSGYATNKYIKEACGIPTSNSNKTLLDGDYLIEIWLEEPIYIGPITFKEYFNPIYDFYPGYYNPLEQISLLPFRGDIGNINENYSKPESSPEEQDFRKDYNYIYKYGQTLIQNYSRYGKATTPTVSLEEYWDNITSPIKFGTNWLLISHGTQFIESKKELHELVENEYVESRDYCLDKYYNNYYWTKHYDGGELQLHSNYFSNNITRYEPNWYGQHISSNIGMIEIAKYRYDLVSNIYLDTLNSIASESGILNPCTMWVNIPNMFGINTNNGDYQIINESTIVWQPLTDADKSKDLSKLQFNFQPKWIEDNPFEYVNEIWQKILDEQYSVEVSDYDINLELDYRKNLGICDETREAYTYAKWIKIRPQKICDISINLLDIIKYGFTYREIDYIDAIDDNGEKLLDKENIYTFNGEYASGENEYMGYINVFNKSQKYFPYTRPVINIMRFGPFIDEITETENPYGDDVINKSNLKYEPSKIPGTYIYGDTAPTAFINDLEPYIVGQFRYDEGFPDEHYNESGQLVKNIIPYWYEEFKNNITLPYIKMLKDNSKWWYNT